MFDAGERQVAPELSGIRRDHVARYEWAAKALPPGSRVLDAACGVGYGSYILARSAFEVTGVDRSAEALEFGRTHYGHAWINQLVESDLSDPQPDAIGTFDAVVCFETIEHLADPLPMLRAFHKAAPVLLASVPNEEVFPFKNYAFHHRHYTRAEFVALLEEAGYKVDAWFGQEGPYSEIEPDCNGRTVVVKASRREAGQVSAPIPGKPAAPAHVAIVGLGPSAITYFELVRGFGGASAYCDEVWAVNALGDVLKADRVFHMDDVWVQERRAAAKPTGNIAAMVKWLKRHPGPIYTSTVRPGYPGLVAFPLEEVINGGYDSNGGAPYFNNTVAYAIAFAIHIGVKHISLFGVDFTRPNAHHSEMGRACCEFWLGIAAARGIEITLPDTSTLMDACAPEAERLYGYDGADVLFHREETGKVRLEFKPKDLPTAEEIEARYDHSKHPNRLMEAENAKD